jgi:Reverse transcriptase (RNA-dependent DNA polymerase)
VLLSINYSRANSDLCIFYRNFSKNHLEFVAVYVNDPLLGAKTDVQIDVMTTEIKKHFSLKDLNGVRLVIGCDITVRKDSICVISVSIL